MKTRRLRKSIIPFLYAIIVVMLIGTIFMIESAISKNYKKEEYQFVSETIFDHSKPVVNTEILIGKPYTDSEVKILKSFYNYKGESEDQQNSILFHEDTYLPNTGVVYGGKENFDIVSILDGEVTDLKTDPLLGTIVEIKHSDSMIGVYQSIGEVMVKKGDMVKIGQIIGKSGTSNVEKDLGSHLLFELIINGQTVNPEDYYGKKVSEI